VAIIIFDIETGPLSEEQVLAISGQPPELSHPGEFSQNSVKLGVMKDPAKIEAKVAEARAKHEAAVAAYEENKAKALAEWKESSMRSAALSAVTGQVLAVGFRASNGKVNIQMGNEQEMLAQFWGLYARARSSSTKLAGHCIFQFDLPFMVRRSWLLGVEVPATVFDGRYFDGRVFIDTAKFWLLGQYGGEKYSLDLVDKFFGGQGKNGNGADFARLLAEDAEAAKAYLANDLEMNFRIAQRMGVA
jgi:hypothetical protein